MSEPVTKPSADEDVPEWVGAYMSTCIGCTQTDNHPKVQIVALGAPPVYWHHDCYVIVKAPGWEQVRDLIAGAPGVTGHALRTHLLATTAPPQGDTT